MIFKIFFLPEHEFGTGNFCFQYRTNLSTQTNHPHWKLMSAGVPVCCFASLREEKNDQGPSFLPEGQSLSVAVQGKGHRFRIKPGP